MLRQEKAILDQQFPIMYRLVVIVLLLTASSCSHVQSLEESVCHCIETNYNSEGWNYLAELKTFEQELIQKNKLSQSVDSKLELLRHLNYSSSPIDFYKTEFSERLFTLGDESLWYCIRKGQFDGSCDAKHWSGKLLHRLRQLKLNSYNSESAKDYGFNKSDIIIKELEKVRGDTLLKELILLQELYHKVPDEQLYNLDLKSNLLFENAKSKVPANAIQLHTTRDSLIIFKDKEYALGEICLAIDKDLELNKPINLKASKHTIYKFYLEVFQTITSCLVSKRDDISVKKYEKKYDALGPDEKIRIDELIDMSLIESR